MFIASSTFLTNFSSSLLGALSASQGRPAGQHIPTAQLPRAALKMAGTSVCGDEDDVNEPPCHWSL
jgi:hypothetical protein